MMVHRSILVDGGALADAERLVRSGLALRRASFEVSFDVFDPHRGYLVVAGTETLVEALRQPLAAGYEIAEAVEIGAFSEGLAKELASLSARLDVDLVPEGTVVFPGTPIGHVEGTLLECVLVGGLVRACLERATRLATHFSRLHTAADGDLVVDGASSSAPSLEAGLVEARAAFVGGAAATTNAHAAVRLGLPFRAHGFLELSEGPSSAELAWGASSAETLAFLGDERDEDEELALIERKRRSARAGGFVATGRGAGRVCALRWDLVAIEEDGAWTTPRIAPEGRPAGRRRLTRYSDESGRLLRDLVHLQNERIATPHAYGAASLHPLARPAMRAGRGLLPPDEPQAGRERALVGRRALPPAVAHLRSPAPAPVEISAGASARTLTDRG